MTDAETNPDAVAARLEETADRLRELGAEVTAVAAPYRWSVLLEAWETMAAVGIRAALATAPVAAPVSEGLQASAARAARITGSDYLTALKLVARLRSDVESALSDVDLVLCPTTLSAAWPLDAPGPVFSDGTVPDPGNLGTFTHWVNAVGRAALSMPVEPFADGRPIGVQLVAMKGGEDLLLATAALLRSPAGAVERRSVIEHGSPPIDERNPA